MTAGGAEAPSAQLGNRVVRAAGRFSYFVLDGFEWLRASLVAARSIIAVLCSPAPRQESFVGADDFDVVTNGVRSRALEYGAPKTGV